MKTMADLIEELHRLIAHASEVADREPSRKLVRAMALLWAAADELEAEAPAATASAPAA